jgi:hypothetical protein
MMRCVKPRAWSLSPSILLARVGLCLSPVWVQKGAAKNRIYHAWGIRDTQYGRNHWPEMEQMPLDGDGIVVDLYCQACQHGARG